MCEKKRIVLRYLWTFLVCMDKITCKADLERHHTQVSWKESFKGCGSFGGASLFQNCQAKTCNASAAKGRIGGLVGGYTQEYWINGYVQRSPVLTYKGCFWVKNVSYHNFKNVTIYHDEPFKLIEDCFSHFNSGNIYLQRVSKDSKAMANVRCLMQKSLIGEQVSDPNCRHKCGDDLFMMCGGNNVNDDAFISVYQIQRLQKLSPLGKTCYMSKETNGNRNIMTEFCSKQLKSVCESFSRTGLEYYVTNTAKTWYESQRTCSEEEQHLVQNIDVDRMVNDTNYWIGHFAIENVTWEKEDVPENAQCLKLVLKNNTGNGIVYNLETGDCNDRLYPLCVSVGSAAHSNPQNNLSTLSYAISSSSATDGSLEMYKSTENAISSTAGTGTVDHVGAVIGGVIGGVLVVGLAVAIIYKRNRQIKTESSVEASNVQMEMPQRNERSVSRLLSDPNTTEEGVYNHLGDGESAHNVSNGIYDMSGRAENEYDVGTLSAKHGGDSDLYDRAATSGDEYSTLNNKNRPSGKHADTNNEYDF